jgi:uncharacterized protein (TIGR02246 family)
MRRFLISACLVAVSFPLFVTIQARQSPERQVERLALEINQAFVRNDLEGVARHVAPDITWISHTSTERQDGRDVFVKALRQTMARKRTISWQERNIRVQVLGEAAVVSFFYTHHARFGDRTVDRLSRATYVFAKRQGQWLLVHDHSSAVQAGA